MIHTCPTELLSNPNALSTQASISHNVRHRLHVTQPVGRIRGRNHQLQIYIMAAVSRSWNLQYINKISKRIHLAMFDIRAGAEEKREKNRDAQCFQKMLVSFLSLLFD